ncbi:response regulator [Halopiger aswanensis]|uniref:Response regulator receiver domain-containing protein n=1 Tax=Halopiger aswanensis TaxID=148449 RepID=A0A3R7EEV5_9EURY|nr:response regulator [Halopiger aswanensis]RKD95093.1 response regulator receiver domain-containing protein [Halopiger aswanensis]
MNPSSPTPAPDVLLIEDNPGDVRLTKEAFRDASFDADLHVVTDGVEAMAFLHRNGEYESAPRPDIVLLDLNLPRKDGFEVLEAIRDDSDLEQLPVVVLSSSEADEDIRRSYEQHVNAYLTKPRAPDEFVEMVRTLEEFWFDRVELPPSDNNRDRR